MRAFGGKPLLQAVLIIIVGCAIAVCAVVDQYSGRALSYNVEAEQASEQAILLNIIRASQRRPMQFTTVSTITGTATSTGTFGLSAPLGAGGAQYKTGTLGGSFSGGPQFTVPVLDMQEFYDGIMNPIPGAIFDLYIQAGYPRDLLFNLFIDKIVVHNDACDETLHNADCEFTFVNHAYSPVTIDLYQAFVGYLIELGFTTQRINQPTSASGNTPGDNAQSSTKKQQAQGSDSPPPAPAYAFCFAADNPEIDKKFVPPESRYESAAKLYAPSAQEKLQLASQKVKSINSRLQNPKTTPEQKKALEPQLKSALADQSKATIEVKTDKARAAKTEIKKVGAKSVQKAFISKGLVHYLINIAKVASAESVPPLPCEVEAPPYIHGKIYNVCGVLKQLGRDGKGGEKDKVAVTISVYVRSTEKLIYYLGELVRNQKYRLVKFRIQNAYTEFNARVCDERIEQQLSNCTNVFVLDDGFSAVGNNAISVMYEQNIYSISSDARTSGYSMQVLEIVKQMLAMSSSAKSLPQTNVISLLNP